MAKIKRIPEDFRVSEVSEFPLSPSGPFACYRLTKQWIGTPEAMTQIQRRWEIARKRISYGGLKDYHGITQQLLTIHKGPRQDLEHDRFTLEYLGQARKAYDSKQIQANRFEVVIRDLSSADAAEASQRLDQLAKDGVPNYFDDQRFGSVGESGQFIAEAWVKKDYERALWLALAEPNRHDKPEDQEQKALLREHWGDWKQCKQLLDRSHRRSIVTFLDDRPGDFKGALARVKVDLRGLYVSAFQSYLWNTMLAQWLKQHCPAESLVSALSRLGELPMVQNLDDATRERFHELSLPLPSGRTKLPPGELADLAHRVVSTHGLEWHKLRIPYPDDSFFSKGWRAAALVLAEAKSTAEPDELYTNKQKLTLQFDLPRGTYATLVMKRVLAE